MAWLSANVLLLAFIPSVGLEFFFIFSLIGFIAITVLTAPFSVDPPWRAQLKWFIVLGLLGFVYLAVSRILALLPPDIVPEVPGL